MQLEVPPIGILGGMSTVATGEYYLLINEKVRAIKGGFHTSEMVIRSVDFGKIEHFVRTQEWEAAGMYLAKRAAQVEAAGAGCLFIASNTMHKVRAQIQAATTIPFMDIFETTAREINRQGFSKVGLLGTLPVMRDPYYKKAFQSAGIEISVPEADTQVEINRILFDELTKHQFLPASKAYFDQTIRQLAEQGAEGVILGCTEIKLLINQQDIPAIPLFDTTTLHCELAAQISAGMISLSEFSPH